ncbi:MAG: hypothetical protein HY094_04575 [Candidatus Melainabacteria bacterium]|nr:hypothetical protein [Candidatus Melainabacteria bacterium]
MFRELLDDNKTIELSDTELRQLIEKYCFEHPLLSIRQNQEVFYPLAGYCRKGLEENGFIKEDGNLNSEAVFDPKNFDKITAIGKWQFATGVRGCIGETFALEALTWDTLCMAYLLKKFPEMKIVGKTKTNFGIFMGREFKVKDLTAKN